VSRYILRPTSKHLRIAEYQQTYEDLEDQIDALYQAAEDAGTVVNKSRCHSGTPAWAWWKPLVDSCPTVRPTSFACPTSANSSTAASEDGLGGQVVRCAKNSRSAAAIVSGLP
jgi:hypothetical protein